MEGEGKRKNGERTVGTAKRDKKIGGRRTRRVIREAGSGREKIMNRRRKEKNERREGEEKKIKTRGGRRGGDENEGTQQRGRREGGREEGGRGCHKVLPSVGRRYPCVTKC